MLFAPVWNGSRMVYLVSIVDEYPNLDVSCNARYDSVMYDLVPEPTGKRGRPAKKENVFHQRSILHFPTRRLVVITWDTQSCFKCFETA